VPVGYFAYAYVPQGGLYAEDEEGKGVLESLADSEKFKAELLREANVNYVICSKRERKAIPATTSRRNLQGVRKLPRFAVFQVHPSGLSETPSKT